MHGTSVGFDVQHTSGVWAQPRRAHDLRSDCALPPHDLSHPINSRSAWRLQRLPAAVAAWRRSPSRDGRQTSRAARRRCWQAATRPSGRLPCAPSRCTSHSAASEGRPTSLRVARHQGVRCIHAHACHVDAALPSSRREVVCAVFEALQVVAGAGRKSHDGSKR